MGTAISYMESFHYNENTETVDTYVARIGQLTLLGYGEPQILELFKNTLPNRLYWVLFPIDNIRLAVEREKGILTKVKIDRQLSGQSSTSMPFKKVSECYNLTNKKSVSFNTQDRLDNKIDKLMSMMSTLTAQDKTQHQDTI